MRGGWIAAGLVVLGLLAAGAEAAEVTGTLTLDARKLRLVDGVVVRDDRVPELETPGIPATTLRVILADRDIALGLLSNPALMAMEAAEGRVEGLMLEIDPETGAILSGQHLAPEAAQLRTTGFGGDAGQLRVRAFSTEGGVLALTLRTKGMIEAFHMEGDPNPERYALDLTLRLPLPPAPELVAVHEGEAARKSGPGRAFATLVKTVEQGEVGAVKALVAPASPLMGWLDEVSPAEWQAALIGTAKPKELIRAMAKVYEYRDSAVVVVRQGEGVMTMPFLKVDGVWLQGAR